MLPSYCFVTEWLTLTFPLTWFVPSSLIHKCLHLQRLNASLGDLILNEIVLLILCVHLFRNYKSFTSLKFIYRENALAWVLSVVSALCVLYAALFPFVVIQTLYNNSSIILDLSQSLRFDQLRVFATIAVLLSGICSFLFSHTFIRLLIADGARARVLISFFIGAILFSVININNPTILFILAAAGNCVFFIGLLSEIIHQSAAIKLCYVRLPLRFYFLFVYERSVCH